MHEQSSKYCSWVAEDYTNRIFSTKYLTVYHKRAKWNLPQWYNSSILQTVTISLLCFYHFYLLMKNDKMACNCSSNHMNQEINLSLKRNIILKKSNPQHKGFENEKVKWDTHVLPYSYSKIDIITSGSTWFELISMASWN